MKLLEENEELSSIVNDNEKSRRKQSYVDKVTTSTQDAPALPNSKAKKAEMSAFNGFGGGTVGRVTDAAFKKLLTQ